MGGALGIVADGAMALAAVEEIGCEEEDCELEWLFRGTVTGEAALLPLGSHLGNKRAAPPERVLELFEAFVAAVHETLPETQIYFLAIKPSIARWASWPQIQKANKLISADWRQATC